jgi:hypothetical protein
MQARASDWQIVQNAAGAGDACTVVDEAAADLHLDAASMIEHRTSFTWSDGCHSRPSVAVLEANTLIAPQFVVASQRDAARSIADSAIISGYIPGDSNSHQQ